MSADENDGGRVSVIAADVLLDTDAALGVCVEMIEEPTAVVRKLLDYIHTSLVMHKILI